MSPEKTGTDREHQCCSAFLRGATEQAPRSIVKDDPGPSASAIRDPQTITARERPETGHLP